MDLIIRTFLITCLIFTQIFKSSAQNAYCIYYDYTENTNITATTFYTCSLNTEQFEFSNDEHLDIQGEHLKGRSDQDVVDLGVANGNRLNILTSDLCNKFSNLEILSAFESQTESVDENALQNCQNLMVFQVIGNKIQELPENLFVNNSKLEVIFIRNNKDLTELPEDIFRNQNLLENLDLSGNDLSFLPTDIFSSLKNLRLLHLSSNKLEALAVHWFQNLHKLLELGLNDNQLWKLPPEVFKSLIELQKLYLHGNRIEQLHPDCFVGLKSLKLLALQGNKISNLPEGVFRTLRKLEVLYLTDNKLSVINSDSFGIHRQLATVRLDGNKITSVDEKFVYITAVSHLNMSGNLCSTRNFEDRLDIKEGLMDCFERYQRKLVTFMDKEEIIVKVAPEFKSELDGTTNVPDVLRQLLPPLLLGLKPSKISSENKANAASNLNLTVAMEQPDAEIDVTQESSIAGFDAINFVEIDSENSSEEFQDSSTAASATDSMDSTTTTTTTSSHTTSTAASTSSLTTSTAASTSSQTTSTVASTAVLKTTSTVLPEILEVSNTSAHPRALPVIPDLVSNTLELDNSNSSELSDPASNDPLITTSTTSPENLKLEISTLKEFLSLNVESEPVTIPSTIASSTTNTLKRNSLKRKVRIRITTPRTVTTSLSPTVRTSSIEFKSTAPTISPDLLQEVSTIDANLDQTLDTTENSTTKLIEPLMKEAVTSFESKNSSLLDDEIALNETDEFITTTEASMDVKTSSWTIDPIVVLEIKEPTTVAGEVQDDWMMDTTTAMQEDTTLDVEVETTEQTTTESTQEDTTEVIKIVEESFDCGRIIGSNGSNNFEKFPWIATLVYDNNQVFCHGALVSNQKVVTAGRCIEDLRTEPRDIFVVLGNSRVENNSNPVRILYAVKKIHLHEEWNHQTKSYDAILAVLILEDIVAFTDEIHPICSINGSLKELNITKGYILGYSHDIDASSQNIPRANEVSIQIDHKCLNSNSLIQNGRSFCQGTINGTKICESGNGSGLYVEIDGIYYLRGVIIGSGLKECKSEHPLPFIDILKFNDWIENVSVNEDYENDI